MCLPMGCSLSCSYFEAFSTFLHWVLCIRSGSDSIVHYMDDFLFVGPSDSRLCSDLLLAFQAMSLDFGVPLADEKTCLPSTTLEFLGIEIDTRRMEFCLPVSKLSTFKWLITTVLQKKKIRLKEMQSPLGVLAFACRIMSVGRIFSHQLYLAISGLKSPLDHVRITIKEDFMVCSSFLDCYNGRSFFQAEFV